MFYLRKTQENFYKRPASTPFLHIDEVSGEWPDGCKACERFLSKASLKPETLVATLAEVHAKVETDMKAASNPGGTAVKPLKRASLQQDSGDQPPVKSIKVEGVLVKRELDEQKPETMDPPGPSAGVAKAEAVMGKHELVALHNLEILRKDTEKKRNPIRCPHCSTTFEGRNRAKVAQHVAGLEHRRRWSAASKTKVKTEHDPATQEFDQDAKGFQVGECGGLRLLSSFGKRSRLGTDMLEVWRKYMKYANMERTCRGGVWWGGVEDVHIRCTCTHV